MILPLHKLSSWVSLTLFSLLLFLPGLSKLPALDRDEAHFAQATRQMLQTGQYFQIRFQEKTRFQKPPGINWLQAAAVKAFGVEASHQIWPYRLPSLLGGLLSVGLLFFFAKRFVDSKIALLSAFLLGCSLLLVIEVHMAVIDACLLASVLLMQGALWIVYQEGMHKEPHWAWAYCFWLAMSLGCVLKGVTPLIGLLTVLALCGIEKRAAWLTRLKPSSGLTIFILINLLWIVAVNQAEQSNYLLEMLHRDLLPKLKTGHESHGHLPFFHLAILPLTFWPSSLFLFFAFVYAWKNKSSDMVKFLLAWMIPSWIFFELMPTKLPQYTLPLFPPLALLTAAGINEYFFSRQVPKWLRGLQYLWGLLSLGLGASFVLIPYLLFNRIPTSSLILLIALCFFTAIILFCMQRRKLTLGLACLFLMAFSTYFLAFNQVLPNLSELWTTNKIAHLLENSKPTQQQPLLVVGFEEPSLVFSLGTKNVKFSNLPATLSTLAQSSNTLALIEKSALIKTPLPSTLTVLQEISGYNYSKGKWVNLILVGNKI